MHTVHLFLLSVSQLFLKTFTFPLNQSFTAEFLLKQGSARGWGDITLIGINEGQSYDAGSLIKALSKGWKEAFALSGRRQLPEPVQSRLNAVCFWYGNMTSEPCPRPSQEVSWLILVDTQNSLTLKKNLENSETVGIDSDILLGILHDTDLKIHLQQVYKITETAPLTIADLGSWSPGLNLSLNLLPVEVRKGELQNKLKVGIKNESLLEFDEMSTDHIFSAIVEIEEAKHVLSLVRSILSAINVSYDLVSFPKMGWHNEEGEWSYMLGAVVEGKIEFAAGTLDMSTESARRDMYLTNAIVRSLSSIYMRRQSGRRLKDVFQSTFNPRLQLSVLLTTILLGLGMLAITLASSYGWKSKGKSRERSWEPSEALLWTVSVMCMQGSFWSPKSASGCLLLLFSLLFALITYNSFAAFITSILSVHDIAIKTIADLQLSNLQFGFPQDSNEEQYLREVEDTTLRALYYKGLISGGSVTDVNHGLRRIFEEPFSFFASTRIARRAIHSVVPPSQRCSVMELAVYGTETVASLPVTKSSHYKLLINFWLLRMRETGVLNRIRSHILPPMPNCNKGQQFSGASFDDLATAYALYTIGFISSCIMFLLEMLWYHRGIFQIFNKK